MRFKCCLHVGKHGKHVLKKIIVASDIFAAKKQFITYLSTVPNLPQYDGYRITPIE